MGSLSVSRELGGLWLGGSADTCSPQGSCFDLRILARLNRISPLWGKTHLPKKETRMRTTNRSPVGVEQAQSQKKRAWPGEAWKGIKALLLGAAVAGLYFGTIALLMWPVLDAAAGKT